MLGNMPPPKMLVLTPDNVIAYLRARGLAGPLRAELLSGGVSNVVFRVEHGDERFVLKQSCPQLRTRDAWFSDVNRIYRELEVMQALGETLPPEIVPCVLWVDRDNFAFAMSHAPDGARPWKDDLLAGMVDPRRGQQAGEVLGRIHEFSVQERSRFEPFADATVFVQLRVEPFYQRLAQRIPDVAPALAPLIEDMLHRKVALCHGDFTPKNMLLHDSCFTLVDYETGTFGEPAMDLGLFTAHLVLKSVRRPDQHQGYRALIDAFLKAYRQATPSLPRDDHERRGRLHLGACSLARVDGTSPVDYLDDDGKNQVRVLARELLFGHKTTWDLIR